MPSVLQLAMPRLTVSAADDVGLNVFEGLEKFLTVMGGQMLERLVIEGVHARDRVARHLGLEL